MMINVILVPVSVLHTLPFSFQARQTRRTSWPAQPPIQQNLGSQKISLKSLLLFLAMLRSDFCEIL